MGIIRLSSLECCELSKIYPRIAAVHEGDKGGGVGEIRRKVRGDGAASPEAAVFGTSVFRT